MHRGGEEKGKGHDIQRDVLQSKKPSYGGTREAAELPRS